MTVLTDIIKFRDSQKRHKVKKKDKIQAESSLPGLIICEQSLWNENIK